MSLDPQSPITRSILPGIRFAFDPSLVVDLLNNELPESKSGTTAISATIQDLHYTPDCLAVSLWKVTFQVPFSSHKQRQLITIRAFNPAETAPSSPTTLIDRYTSTLRSSNSLRKQYPLETPWLCLPRLGIVILAFPLDPDIPSLIDVVYPRYLSRPFRKFCNVSRGTVTSIIARPLAYTPSARVALKYDIGIESQEGLESITSYVGKVDNRRSASRLYSGHWALWSSVHAHVSVPKPVGYISTSQISFQQYVAGMRVSDFADSNDLVSTLERAAVSLGHLHSLRLPLFAVRGFQKEVASLNRWASILTRISPGQSGTIEKLRSTLEAELYRRQQIKSTIHADFHLANMLVGDSDLFIIDWDQIALGDPMVDIGRVLASLRVTSLRTTDRLDRFSEASDNFLSTYLDISGDDYHRAKLYESASLLIAAATPFRLQRPAWQESADLMIHEAVKSLDASFPYTGSTVTPRDTKYPFPFELRSAWLNEPIFMRAILIPHAEAFLAKDIEVNSCLCQTLRIERRLIHSRWTLKCRLGPDKSQCHFEGLTFSTHSGRGLLRRLEQAAPALLDANSAFSLPVPFGYVSPLSVLLFAYKDCLFGHASLVASPLPLCHDFVHAFVAFSCLDLAITKTFSAVRAHSAAHRYLGKLVAASLVSPSLAQLLLSRIDILTDTADQYVGNIVVGLDPRYVIHDTLSPRFSVASLSDLVLGDIRLSFTDFLSRFPVDTFASVHGRQLVETYLSAFRDSTGCTYTSLTSFFLIALLNRLYEACYAPDSADAATILLCYIQQRLEFEGFA